ncbi:MAG TPA: GlsB/YeaQ/YmgE family stress response membrane protein [Candidatus Acidoferrales bacterium]|nr:GlsB/YeaQ/YmgE family stress response membrane protein [Candidatus Acidoferrales bacterium]
MIASLAAATSPGSTRGYGFVFVSHGLILWIIIGLIAGWIAGKISRGRGFGCLVNIILGLIGAVIGGWIFTRLGIEAFGFLGSLAAATVGAVILVAIARLFSGSGPE